MFAVIKTGGKQYKVAKDDVIVVESLAGDPGALVELDTVLMLGGDGSKAETNNDQLDKAAVFAEVVKQTRGEKVVVFKKKRRHNYRRKRGHRQELTVLRILDVSPTGTKPKVTAKKAPAKAPAKEAAKPAAESKPTEKAEKTETTTKAATKKAATKKAAEKAPAKKAPAKKIAAKKTAAKKAPAKKQLLKKRLQNRNLSRRSNRHGT